MKILNDNEISYIKGIYLNGLLKCYGIFLFNTSQNWNTLDKYIEKKKEAEEEIEKLQYERYELLNLSKYEKGKIKDYFQKKINKEVDKLNVEFNEKNLISLGIKLWFEQNLIIQVKRPNTRGNKGDYVGDEKTDEQYRKSPIFVKFDNKDEYKIYKDIFIDGNNDDYKRWFNKNQKNFTIIFL